jgi:hypothetical protein
VTVIDSDGLRGALLVPLSRVVELKLVFTTVEPLLITAPGWKPLPNVTTE